MAIEKRRMQQRYGTYEQFQSDLQNILDHEFISVDSGDTTLEGTTKGLYFKFPGGNPVRIYTTNEMENYNNKFNYYSVSSGGDVNNIKDTGFYNFAGVDGYSNIPDGQTSKIKGTLLVVNHKFTTSTDIWNIDQYWFSPTGEVFARTYSYNEQLSSGSWMSWKLIATDFNAYKTTIDKELVDNENRIVAIEKDLKVFSSTNIIDDYNSNKVGYFSSDNVNNKGSYTDGEYLLSTSADNTDRAKWVFNSERQLPENDYYIGFDYVSNTDFNLGVKIDGTYKDLGKIGAITDNEKHTFVTMVNIANSLNLYEVYLPNKANLNCRISNFFVKSKEDYVKTFNSIDEFVSQHTAYDITPEMFGAVGNGVFDDTTALQKAIDYCVENGKQLKCQNDKTYCISNPLNLSNTSTCLIDFNWATLKAIKTMDYMITFDGSANTKNDVKTLVKNIIIDCNKKAGGLNLIYSFKFTFDSFMIKNCQTVAIWIQKGGAFVCQNGTIIGDCTPDSRGIYNQTSDCHFHEIVIVDMKKCIFNGGTNFYHKVHGWLTSKVANSIFFTHFAGFGSLTQCQCDTYETGYLLRTSYDLSLVACTYYNNYHLYDSEVTPVVFKFNSGIHPYARRICCTNCSFNSPQLTTTLSSVTDAQITFNGYTHFINIDGYNTISRISPALQAKVTADFENSVNKLIYRNGLCYYDFSLKFTSAIGASNLLEIATIQSPYYPLENQMFPCYLTKTLAGSDCIIGKLLIGTDGKVQVRVPSGNVTDYQYLYAHCYFEPRAIGE